VTQITMQRSIVVVVHNGPTFYSYCSSVSYLLRSLNSPVTGNNDDKRLHALGVAQRNTTTQNSSPCLSRVHSLTNHFVKWKLIKPLASLQNQTDIIRRTAQPTHT